MATSTENPDLIDTLKRQTGAGTRFFRNMVAGTGKPQPGIFIPDTALPKGYKYTPRQVPEKQNDKRKGLRTVAFHAHPSDISGDFLPYLFLLEKDKDGAEFQSMILSKGEGTKAVNHPKFEGDDIIKTREQEEAAACGVLGMKPSKYLEDAKGNHFPDGYMMNYLPAIRDSIRKYIEANEPERIILPAPYPDHADHLAIYIAGMNAIRDLQNDHYFNAEKKIEILLCEPEFGVTKGRKGALDKIPAQFGGNKIVPDADLDGIIYPQYRFHRDAETGKITPAENIFDPASDPRTLRKTHSLDKHTIAQAPYIVSIPEEMVRRKIEALEKHQTQVGVGTPYKEKIIALDRLRGLETGTGWGVGIYPVKIPSVTREDQPFLDNLNPDIQVFQLEKRREIGQGR